MGLPPRAASRPIQPQPPSPSSRSPPTPWRVIGNGASRPAVLATSPNRSTWDGSPNRWASSLALRRDRLPRRVTNRRPNWALVSTFPQPLLHYDGCGSALGRRQSGCPRRRGLGKCLEGGTTDMARDVANAAGVGIGEGAERRGPAGRGTVLVVDDDPIGLRLASLHLKLAGYTVLPCVGGQAALAAAADDHPDLILLDVRLPDLDGYEVCSRLKQNPATAGIPVVLLTALNDREDRLRALELGADDFLSKPYDQAELLARARSLVQQRRLHEQLTQSEARYRSLLANLPDVVWRLDRAGAYLFVSPTGERVCGLAAGELYTSGMDRWLGRVHHTDAKRVAAAYAGLLAGRAPLD